MMAFEASSSGGFRAETPMSAMARLCTAADAVRGYSISPVSLGTTEVALKSPVPVAEKGAQSRRDDWRRGAQWGAELECDAVTHNSFGITVGCHRALVPPRAHAHHRGLLVESAAVIQFCDGQQVIVEWQHTEQSQPTPSDWDADRHSVDGQRSRAAWH